MNELRKLITLNARWYEFLEEQDDTTIEAIISGASRLAALRDDESPADSTPRRQGGAGSRRAPTAQPSRDPVQAAQELPTLLSEDERRNYLNTAEFSVPDLKKMAKLCGLTGYSKLKHAKLVDLLAFGGSGQADGRVSRPAASPQATDVDTEQAATAPENGPPIPQQPTGNAQPDDDAAAIVARLHETDTEEEAAAHLDSQRLDRAGLLAVAAELKLTRVDRLSRAELRRRVLKQAIGARRKFAGLRKW